MNGMVSGIISIPDIKAGEKEWTVVTVMVEVAAQTEMTQMVEYGLTAQRLIHFCFSSCAVLFRVSDTKQFQPFLPKTTLVSIRPGNA